MPLPLVIPQEVGTVLPNNKGYAKSIRSLGGCCTKCAATAGCVAYQFFKQDDLDDTSTKKPAGLKAGVQCYLLAGGSSKKDESKYGLPFAGRHSDQVDGDGNIIWTPSWVGGTCNPAADVTDDPHFTGALGTRFDFNGELNKPFCLLTDKDFHINVMLKGYEDDTAEKGLRSWIKEVGLLWTANGKSHSAHLVARNSKESARGDGFMSRLALDNEVVAVPAQEGEEVTADGFTLRFVGVEKTGPYDVEKYTAEIAGVAKLNLRMRVAHKKLQAPDDAEAHFNIEVVELKQTPKVHGVLGQTFRNSQEQVRKALKYSELAHLLHAPVRADGATGQGFLDGSVGDYEASSVLAPDCRFTSYSAL